MKEIKYSYRLLLNRIRKHDQKYKQFQISGEEIFIPTRGGEVRTLLYRPVRTGVCGPEDRAYPVLFDFHGGGFVFGLPEADDRAAAVRGSGGAGDLAPKSRDSFAASSPSARKTLMP